MMLVHEVSIVYRKIQIQIKEREKEKNFTHFVTNPQRKIIVKRENYTSRKPSTMTKMPTNQMIQPNSSQPHRRMHRKKMRPGKRTKHRRRKRAIWNCSRRNCASKWNAFLVMRFVLCVFPIEFLTFSNFQNARGAC